MLALELAIFFLCCYLLLLELVDDFLHLSRVRSHELKVELQLLLQGVHPVLRFAETVHLGSIISRQASQLISEDLQPVFVVHQVPYSGVQSCDLGLRGRHLKSLRLILGFSSSLAASKVRILLLDLAICSLLLAYLALQMLDLYLLSQAIFKGCMSTGSHIIVLGLQFVHQGLELLHVNVFLLYLFLVCQKLCSMLGVCHDEEAQSLLGVGNYFGSSIKVFLQEDYLIFCHESCSSLGVGVDDDLAELLLNLVLGQQHLL